jgi:hypothetical protein
MQILDDPTIEHLLEHGEFPDAIRNVAERVVVILTQSWCSQWHDMQRYLPEFAPRAAFFALEYDQHPWFERIMAYKEDVLGNREVPYLRAYWQGKLLLASNWLPRRTFAALLDRQTVLTPLI